MTNRQPKSRREPRLVLYNNALINLRQLAKTTGIGYPCISGRWRKGERGPDLWRPVEHVSGHSADKPDQVERPAKTFRGEGVAAKARDEEAAKEPALLARRLARAARMEAIKAAHRAEFCRPLIDGSLLSAQDHHDIRTRVLRSAQRMWSLKGLS